MSFGGNTDAITYSIPNNDALFLQSLNFTMECWVKIASGQTDDRYFMSNLSADLPIIRDLGILEYFSQNSKV